MCAVTIGLSQYSAIELCASQSKDDTLSVVIQADLNSANAPKATRCNKPPLYRYKQIWHQLIVTDGALYCQYTPGPSNKVSQYLYNYTAT